MILEIYNKYSSRPAILREVKDLPKKVFVYSGCELKETGKRDAKIMNLIYKTLLNLPKYDKVNIQFKIPKTYNHAAYNDYYYVGVI